MIAIRATVDHGFDRPRIYNDEVTVATLEDIEQIIAVFHRNADVHDAVDKRILILEKQLSLIAEYVLLLGRRLEKLEGDL